MNELLQVVTTTSSQDEAQRIALGVVEKGLAACVQVAGPITSIYRWEGKLETAEEWRCTLKTHRDRWEALKAEVQAMHSYDEPEIIATAVTLASEGYERWVGAECQIETRK